MNRLIQIYARRKLVLVSKMKFVNLTNFKPNNECTL